MWRLHKAHLDQTLREIREWFPTESHLGKSIVPKNTPCMRKLVSAWFTISLGTPGYLRETTGTVTVSGIGDATFVGASNLNLTTRPWRTLRRTAGPEKGLKLRLEQYEGVLKKTFLTLSALEKIGKKGFLLTNRRFNHYLCPEVPEKKVESCKQPANRDLNSLLAAQTALFLRESWSLSCSGSISP